MPVKSRLPKDCFTERQAAEYLKIVSWRTLQDWRINDKPGRPKSHMLPPANYHVFYKKRDLDQWLKEFQRATE